MQEDDPDLFVKMARDAWNSKVSAEEFYKLLPDDLSETQLRRACYQLFSLCVRQPTASFLYDYFHVIVKKYQLEACAQMDLEINIADSETVTGIINFAHRYGSDIISPGNICDPIYARNTLLILYSCLMSDDKERIIKCIEQVCENQYFLIHIAAGALYEPELFSRLQARYREINPFPKAPLYKATNTEVFMGMMDQDMLNFISEIISGHEKVLIGLLLNAFIAVKVSPGSYYHTMFSWFANKVLVAYIQEFIKKPSLSLAIGIASRVVFAPEHGRTYPSIEMVAQKLIHDNCLRLVLPVFEREESTIEYLFAEYTGDISDMTVEDLFSRPGILGNIVPFLDRYLSNPGDAIKVSTLFSEIENGISELVLFLQPDDLTRYLEMVTRVMYVITDPRNFHPVFHFFLGLIWFKWKEGQVIFRKAIKEFVKGAKYEIKQIVCFFLNIDDSEFCDNIFYIPVPTQKPPSQKASSIPMPVINDPPEVRKPCAIPMPIVNNPSEQQKQRTITIPMINDTQEQPKQSEQPKQRTITIPLINDVPEIRNPRPVPIPMINDAPKQQKQRTITIPMINSVPEVQNPRPVPIPMINDVPEQPEQPEQPKQRTITIPMINDVPEVSNPRPVPIPMINDVPEVRNPVPIPMVTVPPDVQITRPPPIPILPSDMNPINKCSEFVRSVKKGHLKPSDVQRVVGSAQFLTPLAMAWGIANPSPEFLLIKSTGHEVVESLFHSLVAACSKKPERWEALVNDVNYDLMMEIGPSSISEIDTIITEDIKRLTISITSGYPDLRKMTSSWRIWFYMFKGDFLKLLLRNAYVVLKSERVFGILRSILYAVFGYPFLDIINSEEEMIIMADFIHNLTEELERYDYEGIASFISVLSFMSEEKITCREQLYKVGDDLMKHAANHPNSQLASFALGVMRICMHSDMLSPTAHTRMVEFFVEMGEWKFAITYFLLEASRQRNKLRE